MRSKSILWIIAGVALAAGVATEVGAQKTDCAPGDKACQERGIKALMDHVAQLTERVTKLERELVESRDGSVFVGVTPVRTNGRFTKSGFDTGIAAGAGLCSDAYAGSHMCTVQEMYNTVAKGRLSAGDTVPKSWVWGAANNEPVGTPESPNEGLADTCGSLTYPTADLRWTGIAMEWSRVERTGAVGLKLHSGPNARCSTELPIACCR